MRPRRAAIAAIAVLALAACGDDGDATLEAEPDPTTGSTATTIAETTTAPVADPLGGFTPAPIEWEDCGSVECATVEVPLDWSDVTGPAIDIAVARDPAEDDDAPPGFLAYNLGGPGAEGVSSVDAGIFDGPLSERFDVVSWDPRGIGESAPLSCGDEVEPFLDADPDPDDAAEQSELEALAAAVATECGDEDAEILGHVGTDDVARDLEAIRRAYGEPMSYVGFSYGTLIGLRYAELFPTGAEGIVLDGVVDPAQPLTDLLRDQTTGFDTVIDEAFAQCPSGAEGCPDGGAAAAYDRLAAQVEQEPIPASGGGTLGPAELARGVILAGYDEEYWPFLYDGLAAAEDGDASILVQLSDAYDELTEFTPYQAVSCLDSINPTGADAWATFAAELDALSPRFGAVVANEMLPCAFWPVASRPVTGEVRAAGSPPILVVGTTGDAATPLEQAERVAATLDDGHLLVYEGDAHTAYGRDDCIDDAVHDYLLDGVLPPEGTRC
jgi:pimeloyl-ACP methyl ester carboxylesterase